MRFKGGGRKNSLKLKMKSKAASLSAGSAACDLWETGCPPGEGFREAVPFGENVVA